LPGQLLGALLRRGAQGAPRHAERGRLVAQPRRPGSGLRHRHGGARARDPLPLPPDLPALAAQFAQDDARDEDRDDDRMKQEREQPLERTPTLERLLGATRKALVRQALAYGIGTVLG